MFSSGATVVTVPVVEEGAHALHRGDRGELLSVRGRAGEHPQEAASVASSFGSPTVRLIRHGSTTDARSNTRMPTGRRPPGPARRPRSVDVATAMNHIGYAPNSGEYTAIGGVGQRGEEPPACPPPCGRRCRTRPTISTGPMSAAAQPDGIERAGRRGCSPRCCARRRTRAPPGRRSSWIATCVGGSVGSVAGWGRTSSRSARPLRRTRGALNSRGGAASRGFLVRARSASGRGAARRGPAAPVLLSVGPAGSPAAPRSGTGTARIDQTQRHHDEQQADHRDADGRKERARRA